MISLDTITTNGKALFLAYDQGLEHGPSDFDDKSVDPAYILKIAKEGGYNAIIFQKGVAEKYYSDVPLIIKLNGKTNLVKDTEPYSPLLCTVDEAMHFGASAVGYTLYVGSELESEMTEEFAGVVRQAHEHSLPVMAWMYPRGRNVPNPKGPDTLAYAARMGLELGADIVKINYPGSLEALKRVVKSAGKTKVVISGGEKQDEQKFLELAKLVMQSGAIGMAVGRNVWQHENPMEITKKLKEIILDTEFVL